MRHFVSLNRRVSSHTSTDALIKNIGENKEKLFRKNGIALDILINDDDIISDLFW